LAAAIKKQFGIEPTLSVGRTTSFEVKAGDTLIFSKLSTGKFPTDEEVLNALK
jgi:selT/selW/selH-like putative selenoprotein